MNEFEDIDGMGKVRKPFPQGKRPNTAIAPVATADRKRTIFDKLLAKMNITSANSIISESFIRVEQKIINGKQIYDFAIVKDANSDTITERKIDRNDRFLATDFGLFLMKRLNTKKGNEQLHTYPALTTFADNSTTFIGADLGAFYNGSMSVKVAQTVFIEAMDTLRFRTVPRTQESATLVDQADHKSGLVEITPQILFDGSQKNEIRINAPIDTTSLVAHTTLNTDNMLVLFFRGYLINSK